ncbi:hypothetical protein AYI70_g2037, partial [Smittium culicis]
MADNNKSKRVYGFNNIEPARNSTVFLPHIPGKNYENLSSFDEISIFGSEQLDDAILSDEFTYDSDFTEEIENAPEAINSTSATTAAETATVSVST